MIDSRPGWRGLLVSVRDPEEATAALAGGAGIIDVKDPACGPLGAASSVITAAIATVVADRVPWTVACGELAEGGTVAAARVAAAIAALPGGVPPPAAAKAGPAGLGVAEWRSGFARFLDALPRDVEAVAVAYADWRSAQAPHPAEVVAGAAAIGCRAVLFDTCGKEAPGILAGEAAESLPRWIAAARDAGLTVAVAGRLAAADMASAVALGADVVAVRSAACRGGRLGRVDRALVAQLAAVVHGRMHARDDQP